MSKGSGFGGLIFVLVIMVVPSILWLVNAYKFTQCDFVAPYKCEAIHAVGFIPPVNLVTVWFDTDKGEVNE